MIQTINETKSNALINNQINQIINLINLGNFQDALLIGQSLVEASENNPNVLSIMGMLNVKLGSHEDAIRYFRKVVKIRPYCALSSYKLANALNLTGQQEAAISSYKQAIRYKKNYADAHYGLGNVYSSVSNYKKAVTHYKEAIRFQPQLAAAHNNLGTALTRLGRQNEAMDSYHSAISIKPDYSEAYHNLAVIQNICGKNEQAIVTCLKSIEINPNFADAYYSLGEIFGALGKNEEAIRIFERGLKLIPDHIDANAGFFYASGKEVPGWHIPMMNDDPRNQAYKRALETTITEDTQVLEIGAGSGLLAMLAAQSGTKKKITTCEMTPAIASVAKEIVELNGFGNSVEVLAKASKDISIDEDLGEKADLIVSEVISNEFLGEGVLDSVEDAKKRLLAPGGRVIPESGCIMINLVGGEALGKKLYVGEVLGFNLEPFNKIKPRKISIDQQMNSVELLTDDVIAFQFDFQERNQFPREVKTLELQVRKPGKCFGIIQWVSLQLVDDIIFENHPIKQIAESAWHPMFYPFYKPLNFMKDQVIQIQATHNRTSPNFKLSAIDGIPFD